MCLVPAPQGRHKLFPRRLFKGLGGTTSDVNANILSICFMIMMVMMVTMTTLMSMMLMMITMMMIMMMTMMMMVVVTILAVAPIVMHFRWQARCSIV